MTTALPLAAQIQTDVNNRTRVDGIFDPQHKDLNLFFDYPLAPGTYRLAFSTLGNCGDPRLHLAVKAGDGHTESMKDFAPSFGSDIFQFFAVPEVSGGSHFLELTLAFTPATLCRAELLGLRMETAP